MKPKIIYVKDKQEVYVSDKYIYHSSVHKIWKTGACLLDDSYYTCDKPMNLTKVPKFLKKKDYTIHRFIELEGAPEHYLIKKGFKQKQL